MSKSVKQYLLKRGMPLARNDGIDRTSVRNLAVSDKAVGNTQQHNEREKDSYRNPDIIPQRVAWNVHFKKPAASYTDLFAQMEANGTISTRGLKPDATHYCELVFDVNSAYFDNHGGYEFAKQFYADAYKAAIQIVGGEQYILSAVMHADEFNRAMTEVLGREVYHYHLHVVYIGKRKVQELRTYDIEKFYATLAKTPCGQYVHGVKQDLSKKQKKRLLSSTSIHEVHGLRHSSATYQLLQSDGDFKSVQGNTGYATASVLMDTYAHTQDKPRLELTEKIEANFYSQDLTPAAPQPRQNEKPAATKISGKEILEAIRLMDADERRELTRALFA